MPIYILLMQTVILIMFDASWIASQMVFSCQCKCWQMHNRNTGSKPDSHLELPRRKPNTLTTDLKRIFTMYFFICSLLWTLFVKLSIYKLGKPQRLQYGFSLNNETPRWSFSYLDIYCTPYRLKSIVIFPVAKLQTLRYVGFINITSRCTYNLVTN